LIILYTSGIAAELAHMRDELIKIQTQTSVLNGELFSFDYLEELLLIQVAYFTEIGVNVAQTNRNVELYIGRITDSCSFDENPFLKRELPFPTDGFIDLIAWSDRMDPMLHPDVQTVIEEWVSFKNQLRLFQLL
jgi:hypothetical protein